MTTPRERRILEIIRDGAKTATEMAEVHMRSISNVCNALTLLEVKGFVEKSTDKKDSRVKNYALTEKGIKALKDGEI